eukprot:TRINITY_DN1990_c0_g1_i10.p2 TRINITY_DN1990_c0_g1~~TRINITY_DN1990_c0_g1_i10.p2  ORF type:complete len:204 (-),score=-19.14 TRINITY_DN1990_c0_g1_i10:392-1003(-)
MIMGLCKIYFFCMIILFCKFCHSYNMFLFMLIYNVPQIIRYPVLQFMISLEFVGFDTKNVTLNYSDILVCEQGFTLIKSLIITHATFLFSREHYSLQQICRQTLFIRSHLAISTCTEILYVETRSVGSVLLERPLTGQRFFAMLVGVEVQLYIIILLIFYKFSFLLYTDTILNIFFFLLIQNINQSQESRINFEQTSCRPIIQ